MPDKERWQANINDLWVLAVLLVIVLWTFGQAIIGTHDPFGSSMRRSEPWRSNLTVDDAERPESFADDPTTQTWPWAVYAHENIRDGDFPLWNKRMFSGTPFIANRLTALFDPTFLIPIVLFPPIPGLTIFYLIHYLMAAWFMYLFLKSIGISRPAALFGAIAYILQGAYIPWGGNIVADKAYFPMILYYLQRICDRKDRAAIIGYILSFYLLSVNSYPLKVVFSVYISFAWILFTQGKGITPAIKRMVALGAILFTTFLIGCMQHLPMLEFFNLSVRAQPEFDLELGSQTLLEQYDSPVSLLAIMFPMLWGNSLSGAEGPLPYLVMAIYNHAYIGILTAFGFLLFPLVWKKSSQAKFFIVLAFIGLIFIASNDIYMFVASIMPGFRISTVKPDFFALVSMVIVASFVFDHLITYINISPDFRRWTRRVYGWVVGAVIGMAAVAIIARFFPGMFPPDGYARYLYIFKQLIFVWIAGGVLYFACTRKIGMEAAVVGILLLHLIDLLPYHTSINPLIPKGRTGFKTGSIEFLIDRYEEEPYRFFRDRSIALAPNIPMVYSLDEPGGFDSFVSSDYAHFFREIDPPTEDNIYVMSRNSRTLDLPSYYGAYNQPFWDFLNIRYVLSREPMSMLPGGWELAWPESVTGNGGHNDLYIYENTSWLPRFFLVPSIVPVDTIEDGYDLAQKIIPDKMAVVMGIEETEIPGQLRETINIGESAEGVQISINRILEPDEVGSVEVVEYGADEAILEVTAHRDTFLVFSDTYFPGWRAWVDDDEVEVYRTDAIIKGIIVPEGEHTVRFLYDPPLYRLGWILTFVGILLIWPVTILCRKLLR